MQNLLLGGIAFIIAGLAMIWYAYRYLKMNIFLSKLSGFMVGIMGIIAGISMLHDYFSK